MSALGTLAERLRGVIRPSAAGRPASWPAQGSPMPPEPSQASRQAVVTPERLDVAGILGGAWDDPDARRYATIDRVYKPGHRHGRVAMADGLPPAGGWSRLHVLAGAPCGTRLLFVDLETTGLAGGAGTQAFLVGCAWFDGGTFRVRQFLLTSPRGERAMLDAVARLAGESDTVVTYNGKSFDLPLIETRYLFQRMSTPFAGKPHVDMLHTARRLWRSDARGDERGGAHSERGSAPHDGRGDGWGRRAPTAFEQGVGVSGRSSSCRLSELERTLCGHERDGDVPGFEIPARYFRYIRTGDPSSLVDVLEHNRLDLVSLALLTSRAAQLLDAGPSSASSAREAYGLGRLYERGGLSAEARESFVLASSHSGHAVGALSAWAEDGWTRAEALRSWAMLARRERCYEEAARAWSAALTLPQCPAPIAREAAEALAVHHEHRLRDPRTAHDFAMRLLEGQESSVRKQAAERRVARLCRKLGGVPVAAGVLALPELG